MDELDKKIISCFKGKVVRKDLTSLIKKGANVPTYVLEFLLGMYCSTDDETIIRSGFEKIKKIVSENYVKPDQSEYIKSKIKENGEYTIIDKVHVSLDEHEDCYIAHFSNLNISPFEIAPEFVRHYEKLFLGGIWCIIRIAYSKVFVQNDHEFDDNVEYWFTENRGFKKKGKKYSSAFKIMSLKPIQMPNLDLNSILTEREKFTKDEWISLLIRSLGYEPTLLTNKQKLHYLLRAVPLIQKNYCLVELGPRGTGKSHIYSEISPYSILISSGQTSTATMFYNLSRKSIGLVGNWDCIAFDEVGGMTNMKVDTLQTLKNYLANGSFSRGTEAINADGSIAFEGNTFKPVGEMLRSSTLFDPFPTNMNQDTAFFDRINAYLPGWEIPKLRSDLFTNKFGLITDCLAEFCHAMRPYDFTNLFGDFFGLNRNFNTRDETAVRKTFSGLAKLIYPNGNITKDEAKELLVYSIEARRRVKEQLYKLDPIEFKDVDLGFIDLETNEEYIVGVPEQPKSTLIFDGIEPPGYVYAIGRSIYGHVGVYRLENKVLDGDGFMPAKNIEGLPYFSKSTKSSLIAAFNYFTENARKIISISYNRFDYSLYFNDMQNKGVSDEVSVAEFIGLCSSLSNTSVLPGLVVVGRVVMSGTMMPLTTKLYEIVSAAIMAGANKILLPDECKDDYNKLPSTIKDEITPFFYSTPLIAAKIALKLI